MQTQKEFVHNLVQMLHQHEYKQVKSLIAEYIEKDIQNEGGIASDIQLINFVATLKIAPQEMHKYSVSSLAALAYTYEDLISCELALLQIISQNPSQALIFLNSVSQEKRSGTYFSRVGTANLLIGHYADALSAYTQAISLEPELADHYNNLGGALVRLQKLEEALEAYDHCLILQPEHPQANQSKIEVSVQLNRGEKIISELRSKVEENPDNVQLNLALFNTLTRFSKESEAIKFLTSKLINFKELKKINQSELHENTIHVEQLNYRLSLINLLKSRKRFIKALALINQIFIFLEEPSDSLITLKVEILTELGYYEDALKTLQAIKASDNSHTAILSRANIYKIQGKEEKALECLSALKTDDAQSLSMKSRLYLQLGNLEASKDCLLQLANNNIHVFANLITTVSYKPSQEIMQKLLIAADNPLTPYEMKSTINFALSKAYKDQKDFKQSFKYLEKANILSSKDINYQPKLFTTKINRLINNYKPETFSQREKLPKSKPKPIFIVGMPRSGTTLTETIIGSHPNVSPCGELDSMPRIISQVNINFPDLKVPYPICIKKLSRDQLISMANAYIENLPDDPHENLFITDKLPHNFVNVGLIHLLFPNAPIIHVMRDPRDTALSNYQQNFGAKHGGMGYSCDLEHIGEQINDYHRIMHHWRSLNIPMFEFWYEDLVANQELVTRKLLDYCGLPWNEATMSFHKLDRSVRTASVSQVRQKMYNTSSFKWKSFETELEPLINSFDMNSVTFYPSETN